MAADRRLLLAAIGCNLVRALADSIMYVLAVCYERSQHVKFGRSVRDAPAAVEVAADRFCSSRIPCKTSKGRSGYHAIDTGGRQMRASWWFVGFLTLVMFVAAGARPRQALSQTDRLDPIAGLVGQQVTACNYNADLSVRVTGAEWLPVVAEAVAPATEGWLIVLIDVTNVADKSEALTTRPLQLHAEDGRIYAVTEDPPDITEIARAYGVQPPWQAFDPGHTVASVVTFLVPAGAGPLTLVGLRDYC